MIFDIGVEQYIIREQRMRLLRAYSIVVVHGISGPKTWVRFPVCSFLSPTFYHAHEMTHLYYHELTSPCDFLILVCVEAFLKPFMDLLV